MTSDFFESLPADKGCHSKKWKNQVFHSGKRCLLIVGTAAAKYLVFSSFFDLVALWQKLWVDVASKQRNKETNPEGAICGTWLVQWNFLTKVPIGSSLSQIAIIESSRKRPPPVSDHLNLTSRVVAYGRFHCIWS